MEGWRLPSGGLPTPLRAPSTSDKQVAAKGNICLALASDKKWRRGPPRSPRPSMSTNREKKILRRNVLTANMEGSGMGLPRPGRRSSTRGLRGAIEPKNANRFRRWYRGFSSVRNANRCVARRKEPTFRTRASTRLDGPAWTPSAPRGERRRARLRPLSH